jgi:hypothetical protein
MGAMDWVLELLQQHSPAAIMLIVLGAVLVFVLKQMTERAISNGFDQFKKEIELKLTRRSNFEEKVLLDRYTMTRDLESRIQRVMTDLNRRRQGIAVEGLMRGNDIVPLTEVYELLANNRYLIAERFHDILQAQCRLALDFANENDPKKVAELGTRYGGLLDDLGEAMNAEFGLDKIAW